MLFWSSSPVPAPPDMDVFPCTPIDCMTEQMTLTYSFVLPDSRLDVEKMRKALWTVIVEKLPSAGAQVARRNGLLEVHIPKEFSEKTPPFSFTSEKHDIPFSSTTPNCPPIVPAEVRAKPCIVPVDANPFKLFGAFRHPKTPVDLEEFLAPGTPALHLHIVSYTDVTLVGVTAPHILFDLHGSAALFEAWTVCINGQLDDVKASPRNYRPFDELVASVDASKLSTTSRVWGGWYFLSPFAIIYWVLMFLTRLFWEGKESGNWMWIPKDWLAREKEKCMAELMDQGSNEWVGSNDILSAITYKAMYQGRTDATPVNIHNVVNLRPLLPEHFSQGPYTHNAVSHCISKPIPASQLGSQSVLETALVIRRSLNDYRADKDCLRQQHAWLLQSYSGSRPPVFPNAPYGEYAVTSNWRSGKLGALNFAGARVDAGSAEAIAAGPLRPSFAFASPREGSKMPMRGSLAVCSETEDGIWGMIALGEQVWQRAKKNGPFVFV